MNLIDEFRIIVRALQAARIPYAVCGGIAVTIHGYARTTRDIDLLILPEDLERTLDCVRSLGYIHEGGNIPLGFGEDFNQELCRISKVIGKELLTLDLLLVNPPLMDVWTSKEEFTIEEETFWVISPAGLTTMKRFAGRPKDLMDLEQLGLINDEFRQNPPG